MPQNIKPAPTAKQSVDVLSNRFDVAKRKSFSQFSN